MQHFQYELEISAALKNEVIGYVLLKKLNITDADEFLKPKQFLGIYDKNMKEIYEDDVVKFDTFRFTNLIGIIRYSVDYCAYVIDHNDGIEHIWKTNIDSL